MTEQEHLEKRFEELGNRSLNKGIWVYSAFLTSAQQATLLSLCLPCKLSLDGGYPGAERRMACFGSAEDCGYEACPPLVCIKIAPIAPKFAGELTHRDFLGAAMGLGIKREMLGDIIVHQKCGYMFCSESLADYICQSLESVGRTAVKCTIAQALPVESTELPPEQELIIGSVRLDAVAAAVYGLSRGEAKQAVEKGLVSINSVLSQSPAAHLNEHDIVSFRGKGRFIFEGLRRETKKGRLWAAVRIYK